jgi:two-component system sensor histidine kinase DegS
VLRIIQESLANVRKHAGLTRVDVALAGTARAIQVTVTDHGKGFDPEKVATHSSGSEHVGLAGIRERVSLLGGKVTIQSAEGAGTTVRVTIPIAS